MIKKIDTSWNVDKEAGQDFEFEKVIYVQGDKGATISLKVIYDRAENLSGYCVFTLPNEQIIKQTNFVKDGNLFTFTIPDEALIYEGLVKVQITLEDINSKFSIPKELSYRVNKVSTHNSDCIVPQSEVTCVIDLIKELQKKIDEAKEVLETEGRPGEDGKDGKDGKDGAKGERGETGKDGKEGRPFNFSKIYKSVVEMKADFNGYEVEESQYVLISSIDGDNNKIFVKGLHKFEYIGTLGLGYNYGEMKDFYSNGELPDGWIFTNGDVLDVDKYPHMNFLQKAVPNLEGIPDFDLGRDIFSNTANYTKTNFDGKYTKYTLKGNYDPIVLSEGFDANVNPYSYYTFQRITTQNNSTYGMVGGRDYLIEFPYPVTVQAVSQSVLACRGYNSNTSISALPRNTYLKIEEWKDGDWNLVDNLHNMSDFIYDSISSASGIASIKNINRSTKFRLSIDEQNSDPQAVQGNNIYLTGEISVKFSKKEIILEDKIVIPHLKDSSGNFRIMYIGSPAE